MLFELSIRANQGTRPPGMYIKDLPWKYTTNKEFL